MIQVIRESYVTPDWAAEQLIRSGGLNRFQEPNFRVTWGGNLFDWVNGNWSDFDNEGTLIREVLEARYVPKYPNQNNRWIVEQWLPPERFGSPASWYGATKDWREGNLSQLGPYPSRGRYALLSIVNDSQGRFVQLTPTVLDEVIDALIEKKRNPKTLAEKKSEIEAKDLKQRASDLEAIESTIPAFNYQPTVTVL